MVERSSSRTERMEPDDGVSKTSCGARVEGLGLRDRLDRCPGGAVRNCLDGEPTRRRGSCSDLLRRKGLAAGVEKADAGEVAVSFRPGSCGKLSIA